MHFDESHPSVVVPKHNYKRYKMKRNANDSGLNIIKEKKMSNSQFAIMHLLHNKDRRKASISTIENT